MIRDGRKCREDHGLEPGVAGHRLQARGVVVLTLWSSYAQGQVQAGDRLGPGP